jgi:hypothetical protein
MLKRVETAAAVAMLFVLGGCATESEEQEANPTTFQGVALTDRGTELPFGESATVEYSPDEERSTALEITVLSVRRSAAKDFALFNLDEAARAASYFYAELELTNVGEGDVGGDPIPVMGVDADNVLLPPVGFGSPFKPCPGLQIPSTFAPGATGTFCVVYQVADGTDLAGLSFRPDADFDPITWVGQIVPAAKAG